MKKYTIIALLLLVVFSGGCNTNNSTGIQSSTAIAYIYYATDIYSIPKANSFKALLDANGFSTTLIDVNAISATNFRLYDVIIV